MVSIPYADNRIFIFYNTHITLGGLVTRITLSVEYCNKYITLAWSNFPVKIRN